jgi:hypothetical protein
MARGRFGGDSLGYRARFEAIAINIAPDWHALRTQGIMDRLGGFGALMADY